MASNLLSTSTSGSFGNDNYKSTPLNFDMNKLPSNNTFNNLYYMDENIITNNINVIPLVNKNYSDISSSYDIKKKNLHKNKKKHKNHINDNNIINVDYNMKGADNINNINSNMINVKNMNSNDEKPTTSTENMFPSHSTNINDSNIVKVVDSHDSINNHEEGLVNALNTIKADKSNGENSYSILDSNDVMIKKTYA